MIVDARGNRVFEAAFPMPKFDKKGLLRLESLHLAGSNRAKRAAKRAAGQAGDVAKRAAGRAGDVVVLLEERTLEAMATCAHKQCEDLRVAPPVPRCHQPRKAKHTQHMIPKTEAELCMLEPIYG